MARLTATAAAALLLAGSASAHYHLLYPATIGFAFNVEPNGPCGGFTPDFSKDNVTDFHVDGDNIALDLLHPQGTWLFRATLDQTASSDNWTQLFPETQQVGLGNFCEPQITVPASWAGQKGVLGVIVDAPDGLLYQCASVNFVSGKSPSVQSVCTNSSGVTASFVTDANLAALASGKGSVSSATGTGTAAGSAPSNTASGTTSPSPTKNAAAGPVGGSLPLGNALGVVLLAMVGSAYMLL
ncbi:GPI anchored cell wall protein [Niveomyces insectorum RCEF 264]|uniref:GPI anchored cell wall protein n=1 Tax=Niveomyces insectorum RCEF 264 TaxID=1081102 RepID=A0A167RVC6_9HYPO|nr:GPI anchored cell wall protein [Niveomyces insectorum RCEF 264]